MKNLFKTNSQVSKQLKNKDIEEAYKFIKEAFAPKIPPEVENPGYFATINNVK
jgi:hypothetical protein